MGKVGQPSIVKKALDLLTHALPEIIMTYAQQLRREGKQEGMQLGKQEVRREIAKNMLQKAFSTALIAQVTGLSQEEIHTLK